MTKSEYLAALKKLGLTPHGEETRKALSRSARQLAYYASGEWPIPPVIERILRLMLRDV